MAITPHPLVGEREVLVRAVEHATGAVLYPTSYVGSDQGGFALARRGRERILVVVTSNANQADGFEGEWVAASLPNGARLRIGPLTHENASALRRSLPFTQPRPFGLEPSIGLGDRLGLATPGHIQGIGGGRLRPVLAQQSIREMSRTRRSPAQVLDDATWGVLQLGYDGGYGADADHLKTIADIDACAAAGFTMFTIDPSDFVNDEAASLASDKLAERFEALPWDALQFTPGDYRRRLADPASLLSALDLPECIRCDEGDLLRASVKYGRAAAHVARLYAHLAGKRRPGTFDFEISVDETATPTTPAEHLYVAMELRRLGVRWTSLAPRLPGRLEKGVDYIGDLDELRVALRRHAAIARACGPYKLSLHSGSDKFRIYPILAELCGDFVHIKTAGTSYLEALRTIASHAPELYREILAFSRARFAADRATYDVSATLEQCADPRRASDATLPATVNNDATRQVCHVTYGSVLTAASEDGRPRFRARLLRRLQDHDDHYAELLRQHFRRHVAPFGSGGG